MKSDSNYGLIIQRLRKNAGLSIRAMSEKIGRSVGWLSEVENGRGLARLTEQEFDRIVDLMDGKQHREMFRTWVANHKNNGQIDKTFDGAVLKYIRIKKQLRLKEAARVTGFSIATLSKIENGSKTATIPLRKQIMEAYGYNPSSFKNLATDPIRSKVVPLSYKLGILLRMLNEPQIEALFLYVQNLINQPQPK